MVDPQAASMAVGFQHSFLAFSGIGAPEKKYFQFTSPSLFWGIGITTSCHTFLENVDDLPKRPALCLSGPVRMTKTAHRFLHRPTQIFVTFMTFVPLRERKGAGAPHINVNAGCERDPTRLATWPTPSFRYDSQILSWTLRTSDLDWWPGAYISDLSQLKISNWTELFKVRCAMSLARLWQLWRRTLRWLWWLCFLLGVLTEMIRFLSKFPKHAKNH